MADLSPVSIAPLLDRLQGRQRAGVTADEIAAAVALIFDNRLSPEQSASLLSLLSATGRAWDAAVIAKCAEQMRNAAAVVDRAQLQQSLRHIQGNGDQTSTDEKTPKLSHSSWGSYRGGLCDLVGTGGDGHQTYNVSTTAAIIAGALLRVGKHGARASSSRSGAADLLQTLTPRPPQIEAIDASALPRAFENKSHGFAFLYAPTFHPGMRHALPIRKALGFRTIFNVLGPLAHPAAWAVEARVCGVMERSLGPVYAEALRLSGARKALVVCGAEDLDEISCAGTTYCWRLNAISSSKERKSGRGEGSGVDSESSSDEADKPEDVKIEAFELRPADFGLSEHPLSEVLPGKSPSENATTLLRILNNELPANHPVVEFVLMNAAALLVISGICDSSSSNLGSGETDQVISELGPGGGRWKEGVRRAKWAIESGRARQALEEYIEFTNG